MKSVIADSVFSTSVTAAGPSGHITTTEVTAVNIEAINISANSLTMSGNIVPLISNEYTLGTTTLKWKDVWIGPGTIHINDSVTGADADLSVANGVLLINGANQLQVGQLKFVNNNIESTSPDIDIDIGVLEATANLVLNRNTIVQKSLSVASNISASNIATKFLSSNNITVASNITASNITCTNQEIVNNLIAVNISASNISVSNLIFSDTTVQTTGLGLCGSFERNTNQYSSGTTLSNLVTFDYTSTSLGVTLDVTGGKIVFSKPGTYFISFLGQFYFTGGGSSSHNITAWYVKNGSVSGTSTTCTLNKDAESQVLAVINDLVTINSNDYIRFYWWSDITQSHVYLKYTDPVSFRPASPSAKVNVYKVA
jgi:hypothetical protein